MIATHAAGTRILTARGEVCVETLRQGDAVETVTGAFLPVVFLGRRRVDCVRHPVPEDVWPVRVRTSAFADDIPSRDMLLSPDHAIYIDDELIPIRHLLNGVTIIREQADEVVYWHVELPEPAVMFVEGLPCESHPVVGGRTAFENGGKVMQLHPNFPVYRGWADTLATTDHRLVAIRRYLLDRAGCGRELADEATRESLLPG